MRGRPRSAGGGRRAPAAAIAALLVLSPLAGSAEASATVALVIDDLGYDRGAARRALALPPPVAVAVLPGAPHARSIARAARRAGTDVLVHLPLHGSAAAEESAALHAGMADERLRQGVRAALDAVPGAIGLNNHQGSAFTADLGAMRAVMDVLAARSRPLLFIDSRTTAATRAEAAARLAGVPVARRHVFLDHHRGADAIAAAVRDWLARARRDGCALAIGHPRPQTLRVLERLLPRADDVDRVGLRTYIERCGRNAPGGNQWQASSSPLPKARKSSRRSR